MNKRSSAAWVSYDFSNSAYHLLVPTVLFPLVFRDVIWGDSNSNDLAWAFVASAPVLIAGVLGPWLGAYIDAQGALRRTFVATTLLTIVLTAALAALPASAGWLLVLAFGLGVLSFNLSQFAYNAYLPDQTKQGNAAWLSCLAWGLGYLGGIVCLIFVFPLIKGAVLPADFDAFRWSFLIVAVFFAVTALPSLLLMRSGNDTQAKRTVSFGKVIRSLRNWKENRQLFMFLGGVYLINDGLSALIVFTSVFASASLGMATSQILIAFLIVQLVAVPATIAFGWLAERYGYVRLFVISALIWVVAAICFAVVRSEREFFALSILVGFVIGSTPALARAIVAEVAKKRGGEAGEIFGFHIFASRVSSVLGPIIFGLVSVSTGSQRLALASLVLFFAAGLILVLRSGIATQISRE